MEPVIIGSATLYCSDCLDIQSSLQGIDAIVSDPPYGIGYVYGGRGRGLKARVNLKPIHGDDQLFDPTPWLQWARLNRADVHRHKAVVLWGADRYKTRLPENGQFLVWDKSCGQGSADSFVDAEFAWMNRKNARCLYRHFWKGALRAGTDSSSRSKRLHPAQKPVELMHWCLETARIGLGKAVLDPYMGVGSTGVACVTSGRKFVGIEIDPEYFEMACARLEKAQQSIS